MLLNQVMTEAGKSALLAERIDKYHAQAAQHLDLMHPQCAQPLTEQTQKALIIGAYDRATARGIKRTKDHLAYLSLAVQLGLAFEQNPMHRRALIRAGWYSQDGTARRISGVDVPLNWAQQWHGLTALDAEDFDLPHLADTTLALQAGYDAPMLLRAVKDSFPNRTAAVPKAALEQAILGAHHYTTTRNMTPDAAFLFVLACLHLGLRFPVEPRYHAMSAMFEPGAPAATAQVFTQILQEVAPW